MPRPNRIRELREAKGLSQEKLARAVDVSLQTIRNIEEGRTGNPGYFTAVRIAGALGVDLTDLFPEEVSA